MPIALPHVTPLVLPVLTGSDPALAPVPQRGLGGPKPAASEAEIAKAARDFESLLLNQMIKGLRRTVPEAEPKGHEHQLYQELLDERLAQELAGRGGIGIADALRRYLSPGPTTSPGAPSARNIPPPGQDSR